MPLQNRVQPDGRLCAVSARGLLMGNRGGRIHDPETRELSGRTHASRRWISCTLSHKDWHRDVWGRSYTELFFVDEVTALAAGHRPCFLCRREAAKDFAEHWRCCNGLEEPPNADEMDRVLHSQRCGHKVSDISHRLVSLDNDWPEGTIVQDGDAFYAMKDSAWWHWSFEGYSSAKKKLSSHVELITPPQIVAILRDGYRLQWGPLIYAIND